MKAFVAAAKYRSFTRAAESLCVTQAAISKQIKRLEDTLGVELFTRSGRVLDLTSAGRTLFDAAYLSFFNISQAAERVKTGGIDKSELRICVSPAFSTLWLAPRLPDFFSAHPDVVASVIATDDFSVFDPRTQPNVFISMNPTHKESYKKLSLFSERIYPVCSPEFVEKNPGVRSLAGLQQCRLLELGPFGMSQIYEHVDWSFWFALMGLAPVAAANVRHRLRANDYYLIMQMAVSGMGVALGWDHFVKRLLAQGLLVRPVAEELALNEKPHYLFYDPELADDDAFIAFREWLLESLQADDV